MYEKYIFCFEKFLQIRESEKQVMIGLFAFYLKMYRPC